MSQENVDAVTRAFEAYDRGDLAALLDELDPEVEWHPAMARLLGGDPRSGDQVLAIGRLRARGRESGAESESPLAYLVQYKKRQGDLDSCLTSIRMKPLKPPDCGSR